MHTHRQPTWITEVKTEGPQVEAAVKALLEKDISSEAREET